MKRQTIERTTKETSIRLSLEKKDKQTSEINTGIGFFDHMLELLAFHSGLSIDITLAGDLQVDDHHSVEDIGIVLGQALKAALGDKKGIRRYADILLPMDESLIRGALDISNRPYLYLDASFKRDVIGGFSLENVNEFFRALSLNAGITLHLSVLYGDNDHHKVEALFKAFGRMLALATEKTGADVPSSKGVL